MDSPSEALKQFLAEYRAHSERLHREPNETLEHALQSPLWGDTYPRGGAITEAEVLRFEDESGIKVPRAIRTLLTTTSCLNWELPWSLTLNLSPVTNTAEKLAMALFRHGSHTLATIGAVHDEGVALVVQLDTNHKCDVKVAALGESGISAPIAFSSVARMLMVLTTSLGEQSDVEQIRSQDPDGFGGPAWPFWKPILERR